MQINIGALALLLNEILKKYSLYDFILNLPNLTLGPKLAPFSFTPEDINYISEILAQF